MPTKYALWLNKKFLEWQNQQGEPMDQQDFARYLGIRPTTYSGWINGNVPPSNDNLRRVAAKLGYEIYDVLGMPRPTEREAAIATLEALAEQDNPETDEIFDLIGRWFSDHGFGLTKDTKGMR